MPSRNEVYTEVRSQMQSSPDIVRRKYLKELNNYTQRDTIIISSAFSSKKFPNLPSFIISITNEDIHGFMSALHGLSNDKLDLIIHSPGGSAEAVEQIVDYLRKKYTEIRAIIPQNAMSAATMMACACDSIVMGKHSALGPIDPQITFPTPEGHFTAPAQSILDEFEQAKQEISINPSSAPLWIRRLDKYPIGFLKICNNSIILSKEIVEKWLTLYMLKNDPEKINKAKLISEWLGDTNLHKTHGRPLEIDALRNKGLNIIPLESDIELQEKVLTVFHATMVKHKV